MEGKSKTSPSLPWVVPLIPFISDNPSKKLPLYGPLDITDYRKYLDDGKQIFIERFYTKFPHHISLDELTFVHCLAKGGFGKIILVERKNTEKTLYAMKVISKSFMIDKNCVRNILNEKRMLQSLQSPFCLRLDYIAFSKSHIFLLMPFISGGDLFTRLSKFGKFQENLARFYAAQIVLAIEFLQNCDVVHRDLKPENTLLDHFGFLKIADFGLAKVVTNRTYTFCGTVEYAAPEVIQGTGYGKSVDCWSLGIFIFEMNSGHVPFTSDDELETLEKILMASVEFPKHFSSELKSLVGGLLQKNTSKRVGNLKLGVDEIKSHPWFDDVDWLALLNRKVVPPFTPNQPSRFGETNFPQVGRISNISITRPSFFDNFFKDF